MSYKDKSVKPKVASFRRILFLLHNLLKDELDNLVKLKIISPVNIPTEWVYNIVIVKKSSAKIRICLDPQQLNKALKRSHYPFPTIEEIASKLNGSKCFAKLDANSGYWMLPLDEESANICTFQTPFGRYTFYRIEGVIVFQDDILIHPIT
nr:uncharacterized protein K02A2.6-like [Onthophagus taurus]